MDKKPPRPSIPVMRVYRVSNPEAHMKAMLWRRYLLGKDWSGSKFKPGAAKVVTKPAPAAGPAAKEAYTLALCLTFCGATTRTLPEVEGLVRNVNEVFRPALVSLEIEEPSQCEGAPDFEDPACPFEDDLDHAYEWLHLVFVAKLPEDRPVRFSCGRCCVVSDHCDDRTLFQSLALMLGLSPVSDVTVSGRLMGRDTGLTLNDPELAWLRWHAASMCGLRPPVRQLSVPVWVYRTESPHANTSNRTEIEIRQVLDGVNLIWEQAGIRFVLKNWCTLREIGAPTWLAIGAGNLPESDAVLGPIVAHAPEAVHVMLANLPGARELSTHPARGLCLVNDSASECSRLLAYAFGCLLKLPGVRGEDQLLSRQGTGLRLSPAEITRARQGVTRKHQTPARLPARIIELVIPVKLHLVRGTDNDSPFDVAEATLLLEQSNQVWQSAGIRWKLEQCKTVKVSEAALQATYPNDAKVPTTRTLNAMGLTALTGYDTAALNLFLVKHLPYVPGPQFASAQSFRSRQLALIPATYSSEYSLRTLVRAQAFYLQLSSVTKGAAECLMTPKAPGTKLTPTEITKARAEAEKLLDALRPARSATRRSELVLPVRVHLVRAPKHGTTRKAQPFQKLLAEVQAIWLKAGIRLEALGFQELEISDLGVEKAFPDDARKQSWSGFTGCSSYDPGALNLFFLREVTSLSGKINLANIFDSFTMLAREKAIASGFSHALGLWLGLDANPYLPNERLMGTKSGTVFDGAEVDRARAECKKRFPQT